LRLCSSRGAVSNQQEAEDKGEASHCPIIARLRYARHIVSKGAFAAFVNHPRNGRRSIPAGCLPTEKVALNREIRALQVGFMALDREGLEAAHRNMLAIAFANKLARIAWARGRDYQPILVTLSYPSIRVSLPNHFYNPDKSVAPRSSPARPSTWTAAQSHIE
jgi:hypothetical protein